MSLINHVPGSAQSGIFDIANNLIGDATDTIKAAVVLGAVFVIAAAVFRRTGAVALVAIVVVAAAAVWLVAFDGISFLAQTFGDTIAPA